MTPLPSDIGGAVAHINEIASLPDLQELLRYWDHEKFLMQNWPQAVQEAVTGKWAEFRRAGARP